MGERRCLFCFPLKIGMFITTVITVLQLIAGLGLQNYYVLPLAGKVLAVFFSYICYPDKHMAHIFAFFTFVFMMLYVLAATIYFIKEIKPTEASRMCGDEGHHDEVEVAFG